VRCSIVSLEAWSFLTSSMNPISVRVDSGPISYSLALPICGLKNSHRFRLLILSGLQVQTFGHVGVSSLDLGNDPTCGALPSIMVAFQTLSRCFSPAAALLLFDCRGQIAFCHSSQQIASSQVPFADFSIERYLGIPWLPG